MFERKNAILWTLWVIIVLFFILMVKIWPLVRALPDSDALARQSQEQTQTIAAMQAEIEAHRAQVQALNEEIQTLNVEQPFSHGLTATQVKEALLYASDDIFLGEIFGFYPRLAGAEYMIVSERYVIVRLAGGSSTHYSEVLLSYEVERLGQFQNITWTLLDTSWFLNARYFEPRTPRSLTSQASVIVGFYYYCDEIDPSISVLLEAFQYITEEIEGDHLWGEFIRLMYEHTSIRVWDLWIEGNMLYVDLHDIEWSRFNMGATGSGIRFNILTFTLRSLGDGISGISYVEVLVGGEANVSNEKGTFGRIAVFASPD